MAKSYRSADERDAWQVCHGGADARREALARLHSRNRTTRVLPREEPGCVVVRCIDMSSGILILGR